MLQSSPVSTCPHELSSHPEVGVFSCFWLVKYMIFLRHRTSQGLWPRRRGKTRWQFFLFRDCHSLFSNHFLSILISTIFRWSTWRISCSRGVSAPLKGWRHALNISTLMSIGQFYFPGDSLKPPYHGFIVDRNQFYVFTLSQCWRSVNEDQS